MLSPTIKRTIKARGVSERITGLHWDFGHRLEKLGVYGLSEVEELAGGMYEAALHYGGVVKPNKGFFPSHWDAKMLTTKISEACHNATNVIIKHDGTFEIRGLIKEGFEIVTKIDKRGKILTVYPVIKEII